MTRTRILISGIQHLGKCTLLGLLIISCIDNKRNIDWKEGEVMLINDIPVYQEEYKKAMDLNKAMVHNYFTIHHQLENKKGFWNEETLEGSPRKMLIEQSIEDLTRRKVEMGLMTEHGILEGADYETFQKSHKKENKRRKDTLSKGGIIYGPQSMNEHIYLRFLLSISRLKLQKKLMDELITGKMLVDYYKSHKETDFKKANELKVLVINFPKDLSDEPGASSQTTDVEHLRSLLSNKLSNKQVDSLKRIKHFSTEEISFDVNRDERNTEFYPDSWMIAKHLKEGEVSIDEDKSLIIKCIEIKDNGYENYVEIKSLLAKRVTRIKYEKLIDTLVSQARVEVNQNLVEEVEI